MKQPIITSEEIQSIFSNVSTILTFNQDLLRRFKERQNGWNCESKIGDIMIDMAPLLGIYTQFCNNYEKSIASFEKARKKPAFTQFLEVTFFSIYYFFSSIYYFFYYFIFFIIFFIFYYFIILLFFFIILFFI